MEQPRKSKFNAARWDLDKVRYRLRKSPAPHREVRSLDGILKDVLGSLEQPQSDDLLILREAWEKLAGDQLAKHSTPGFIQNFSLFVYVDHPGWLPELERVKRILLQKLQSQYKSLRIRRLNFVLEYK